MKAFITGAAGFIGSNLAVALRAGRRGCRRRGPRHATDRLAGRRARRRGRLPPGRRQPPGARATTSTPATSARSPRCSPRSTRRRMRSRRRSGRSSSLASSTQAAHDNPYGRSKLAAERHARRLRGAHGRTGRHLPPAGRVREVVPPELQLGGGHLLPQRRAGPADNSFGPGTGSSNSSMSTMSSRDSWRTWSIGTPACIARRGRARVPGEPGRPGRRASARFRDMRETLEVADASATRSRAGCSAPTRRTFRPTISRMPSTSGRMRAAPSRNCSSRRTSARCSCRGRSPA